MALPEFAGIAAGIVSFVIGYSWYLITIIWGETKPHPLTWFLLALVSTVLLVTYRGAGATYSLWVPASTLVFSVLIFLVCVYSFWKRSGAETEKYELKKRHPAIVLLVLIALGVYLRCHQTEGAFYLVLVAEVLALSFTLEKTIKSPLEENWIAWLGAVSANVLNWFAAMKDVEYAYILVTGAVDLAIFFFAFRGFLRAEGEKRHTKP